MGNQERSSGVLVSYWRNVRLNRPVSQLSWRRVGQDARNPVIAQPCRPTEQNALPDSSAIVSTGSRRFSPPNRNRPVSPMEIETTGSPAAIDCRAFVLVLMQPHAAFDIVVVENAFDSQLEVIGGPG